MKLFLTSTALEAPAVAAFFPTIFSPKPMREVSVLLISVQDSESDAFYLQKTIDELTVQGIVLIEVFKLREEPWNSAKQYDVIFVCGGNTFVYLDRMRKTGLIPYIIDAVKSGRSVYVGASAGSIIAGPDIGIAGWGSQGDPNDIGLQDLSGLGLTETVVYPHYRDDLMEEVSAFKKTHACTVIPLRDDQGLAIVGDARTGESTIVG